MAFYYRWHPGDYAKDTADLSIIEDCFYRRLLDTYYSTGVALPFDYYRLYAICRAKSDTEKRAVKYVADRYFSKKNDDGLRHNDRADKQIAKMKEKSEKARQSVNSRRDRKPTNVPTNVPTNDGTNVVLAISNNKDFKRDEQF